ncbi:MAG: ArsJ-associated glyceraldehyde-3-phosphate dehydrogenase [Solirubrobacteraceae bacterium]|nr:ArsJ-associated glyceraldehyde-3-phosphate dehydrogenase [Solirubrobacteraceae bacterium]
MTRIAINGFGRIGRLDFRAAWADPRLDVVHVNDITGDGASAAHLLNFDSVHGRWEVEASGEGSSLRAGEREIRFTTVGEPGVVPWEESGVEVVLECSGRFRTVESLAPYFERGVRKVIVAAPVHDERALNVVVGVNDNRYDPEVHDIVTAASCTTNCLAPVVQAVHGAFGIERGSVTTLHDLTNTQVVVDAFHRDPRRARAAGMSLVPTTTGSAKAIGLIFPELEGRLDGLAVRVPLLNASLTDCVFELSRPVTVEELNGALREAAEGPLAGILGYEERPLVSIDYRGDPRSGVVDALSTMVTDGTQAKILAWYDNEWGYANRMVDLAGIVARGLE